MALLESWLRNRLSKAQWTQVKRPLSLRTLTDLGAEQGLMQPETKTRIDSWVKLRNDVVHSSQVVSKAQAREVVDGVLELIEQWNR